MRLIVSVILSCFMFLQACRLSYGQLDRFFIGMDSFDYDGAVGDTDDSLSIGNSYEDIRELVEDYGFNALVVQRQLRRPHPGAYVSRGDKPNLHFLDNAQRLACDVILCSPELFVRTWDGVIAPVALSPDSLQMVLDYYKHPALAGYNLGDEPTIPEFGRLAYFSRALENYDSTLLRMNCLLPSTAKTYYFNDAGSFESFVSLDYFNNSYLLPYLDQVKPNIVFFDHYPIMYIESDYIPCRFFYDLDIIAKACVQRQIPFVSYLTHRQTHPHDYTDKRLKNPAQLNYVIYAPLCYGARGIHYWLNMVERHGVVNDYWQPVRKDSLLSKHIFKTHRKLTEHSQTLLQLKFIGAYHRYRYSTIRPGEQEELPEGCLWEDCIANEITKNIFRYGGFSDQPLILGGKNFLLSYLEDQHGYPYFWLFNKEISTSAQFELHFRKAITLIDVLNDKSYKKTEFLKLYLAPGEARLFKVERI